MKTQDMGVIQERLIEFLHKAEASTFSILEHLQGLLYKDD